MNKTNLEVIKWDEPVIENYSEQNSINIAKVEYKATGHLVGRIKSVYAMYYSNYNIEKPHQAEATYTGYSIFQGKIRDKQGSIVFLR